jgi:hypothetical protein
MSKRPEDRFGNVIEFLTAMGGRRPRRAPPSHRVDAAIGTATTEPLRKSEEYRRLRRRWLPWAAAAALTLAGVGSVKAVANWSPALQPESVAVATQPMAGAEAPPEPVPEPGMVFINSEPWGQLFIDGREAGKTPMAGSLLAAGDHVLRIERDGYEPLERAFTVESGAELRLTDLTLQQRREP